MTNEEKIQAVCDVMDGHAELIAEARKALQYDIGSQWLLFRHGMSGYGSHWQHWCDKLEQALGTTKVEEFVEEEYCKFGTNIDPGLFEIFIGGGTKEEEDACMILDDEKESEEDLSYRRPYARVFYGVVDYPEQNTSYRKEYAQKFYGAKMW